MFISLHEGAKKPALDAVGPRGLEPVDDVLFMVDGIDKINTQLHLAGAPSSTAMRLAKPEPPDSVNQ